MIHRHPILTFAVALLVALFSSTCGGSDSTGPEALRATTMTVVGGNGQTGTVGMLLGTALQVLVSDQNGAGMEGVTVSWTVTSGGGSVGSASSTTGGGGVASMSWTLGTTAGPQSVTANTSGVSSVTFTATADPGPPSTVMVSPQNAEINAFGASTQLTAQLTDANGNVFPGAAFAWASSDDGVATVNGSGLVTAVSNGDATITATNGALEGSAEILVSQDPASVVVDPAMAEVPVGGNLQLAATARDANDNDITDIVLPFEWSSSDDGLATVTANGLLTGVAEGDVTITVGVAGTSATGTADITVVVPLVPFNPAADQNVTGVINASEVNVPAGVTLTVTGPLTINSAGTIVIDGDMTGDCQSVTINGGAEVTITGDISNECLGAVDPSQGLIISGNGDLTLAGADFSTSGDLIVQNDASFGLNLAGGPAPSSGALSEAVGTCTFTNWMFIHIPQKADNGANPGDDGEDGKGVRVSCLGDAVWGGGNALDVQDGGDGADDPGPGGSTNFARGGWGGDGGDVGIHATGSLTFVDDGMGAGGPGTRVETGDGGDGGDATAEGQHVEDDAAAIGGFGGSGGFLGLQADDGDITFQNLNSLRLLIGNGGHGGDAEATGSQGIDCCLDGPATDGGMAEADGGTGGDGGGITSLAIGGSVIGGANVTGEAGGFGGHGGDATAEGGRGGHGGEQHPDGARGGDMRVNQGIGGGAPASSQVGAFATGPGSGGDASLADIPGFTPMGDGGDAGDADWLRGEGGDGWSDCVLPMFVPGGNGGRGGDGSGGLGLPGLGFFNGVAGTATIADATGDGGWGGAGFGPGGFGDGGNDNISDDDNENAFRDGLPGAPCEKKTWAVQLTVSIDPQGQEHYIGFTAPGGPRQVTTFMTWIIWEDPFRSGGSLLLDDMAGPLAVIDGAVFQSGGSFFFSSGASQQPITVDVGGGPISCLTDWGFFGEMDPITWAITGTLTVGPVPCVMNAHTSYDVTATVVPNPSPPRPERSP